MPPRTSYARARDVAAPACEAGWTAEERPGAMGSMVEHRGDA